VGHLTSKIDGLAASGDPKDRKQAQNGISLGSDGSDAPYPPNLLRGISKKNGESW
jgi:hypothetical protein